MTEHMGELLFLHPDAARCRKPDMKTERYLGLWRAFMRVEDLTTRTIEDRTQFIRQVERQTCKTVEDLSRQDLIDWLGNPAWANTTRQRYRSTLHTFFTWMQDEGHRADNPAARLPKVKVRKRTPNPCQPQEIEMVLVNVYAKTRVMIALHYYLGLRVHEIAKVHGRDLNRITRVLTVVGKGDKKVRLPISDALWAIVKDMPAEGWWFPNWKANRLYAAGEGHILGNSVSGVLGRAIKRTGLNGHRAHDFRASTATLPSQAGVDPFIVQQMMRHESMDTTTRYRLVSMDEMRAGFDMLPRLEIPTRAARKRVAA